MTRHQLGAMISRCFALFYFFKLVTSFFMIYVPLLVSGNLMPKDMSNFTFGLHHASMIIYVVLTLGFWFGAKFIGRALAGTEADAPVSAAPPETYMAVVFAAFGCWLLAAAIPDAAQMVSYAFVDGNFRVRTHQLVDKGTTVALYVLLSALFIFGGRGLARLVTRVRKAG